MINELSLSVKTGHDAIVLIDKERIIQIGNNLLSNAVKFTEEGGVSLITEYDNGAVSYTHLQQGKNVSRAMLKGLEKRKHNLEAKLEKVEHAIKSRTCLLYTSRCV